MSFKAELFDSSCSEDEMLHRSSNKSAYLVRVVDSDNEFTLEERDIIKERKLVAPRRPEPKKKKKLRKIIKRKSQSEEFQSTQGLWKSPVKPKKKRLRRIGGRVSLPSESEESAGSTETELSENSDDSFVVEEDGAVQRMFAKCEEFSKGLLERIKNYRAEKYKTANWIHAGEIDKVFNNGLKLKEYQIEGLNWLHLLHKENADCILADEMGLGKTIQTISLLAIMQRRYGMKGPYLVIAPGTTLENWRREFQKWLPKFRVAVYHGSQEERKNIRKKFMSKTESDKINVLLSTYTYFERESSSIDRSFFYAQKFKISIFDEAQAIKDRSSKRYQHLNKICSKRRVLLSGTPVQNNLLELLSLMSFTLPTIFNPNSDQLAQYFAETSEEAELKKIRKALEPFILRRTKKEVLRELSLKKEHIIEVEMKDGVQRSLYYETIRNYQREKAAKNQNVFTHLRKIANHPLLVQNYFGRIHEGVDRRLGLVAKLLHKVNEFSPGAKLSQIEAEISNYSDWELHCIVLESSQFCSELSKLTLPLESLYTSAKFRKLNELLPSLVRDGHRIVLFSQWKIILNIVEELINQLGIKYCRFDGQVILLTTRAGGVGINLTTADTVILHDLDFNPTRDQQAQDRVHRLGQEKTVHVYKLLTDGTVDHKIHGLQAEKMLLDSVLFQDHKLEKQKENWIKKVLEDITNPSSNKERIYH
eukprot:snap_masked-scaffold_7-processed-gene-1.30-mRNA-1 protein AED:0.23 eAED:0.23 QI:0/0/0/0.83/1/1/12/0/703